MTTRTELSIIIPAYNCEAWIDDCLASVLGEMTDRHELILVDDGSTDSTPAILSSYVQQYKNVRVLFCAHKGASGARNAGLRAATGEYIAFVDCDDRLKQGFLAKAAPLLHAHADLCIFGIERVWLNGTREDWTVCSRFFAAASDFADAYIREGRMMIYSNCNKFYRNDLIRRAGIVFEEGIDFGEDRLFNYRYLRACSSILCSEHIMLEYVQRKADSMSGRHVPGYFHTVMALHQAKTDCFLAMSKGTREEERLRFAAQDAAGEISRTLERFTDHPEEIAENLPLVENMIFGDQAPPSRNWYQNSMERARVLREYADTLCNQKERNL